MKEFIEKLIGRLNGLRDIEIDNLCNSDEKETADDGEQIFESGRSQGRYEQTNRIIKIINQLAEEYNNDFCEWELKKEKQNYDYKSCTGITFLMDEPTDYEFCPYCGKKIKVVE